MPENGMAARPVVVSFLAARANAKNKVAIEFDSLIGRGQQALQVLTDCCEQARAHVKGAVSFTDTVKHGGAGLHAPLSTTPAETARVPVLLV